MTLVSLTIPETPAERTAWLESHLVGTQLGELVAELEAVHGTGASAGDLSTVCGGRLNEVLAFGLQVLSQDQISQLLRHPTLLLDLQDAILQGGGTYWIRFPVPRAEQLLLASQWKQIEAGRTPPAGTAQAEPVAERRGRRGFLPAFLAAVVSAAATLAVMTLQRPPLPVSGWGWDRPGALAVNLPPDQYLEHLATAAEEWFKKRPDTPQELARRVAQFRQGCSTLILAEHAPLAPADRDWLRERCRAWAARLDGHLGTLESGGTVADVRKAADETVTRLIAALRERSRTVG